MQQWRAAPRCLLQRRAAWAGEKWLAGVWREMCGGGVWQRVTVGSAPTRRAKLLEEQLAEEKQACAQQTRLAHSAEAENRKLRADVLTRHAQTLNPKP